LPRAAIRCYDLEMRASLVLVGIVWVQVAAADPAPQGPVNLLTAVPTTVAVSSTVANRAILPHHLVDGDPTTAWNSRTGDLVGAWIAVRVPDGAHVSAVRLTAGFTRRDPRLGDLFTGNPRIKKVRVTHRTTVVERELNVDDRGLQDIAITGGGGDYRIEVLQIVPGSRSDWREVCVSELELWGTAPGPVAGRHTPTVRVGSLDPPPLFTEADCEVLAAIPLASDLHALVLSESLAVCDVVSSLSNPHDPWDVQVHDLFAVVLPDRREVGEHARAESQRYGDGFGPAPPDREAWVTEVVLTPDESAVLVEETAGRKGTATLYRVSATSGLTAVLALETRGRRCTVTALETAAGPQRLPELTVDCGRGARRYRHAAGKYVKR
jgi:hypothetical protein